MGMKLELATEEHSDPVAVECTGAVSRRTVIAEFVEDVAAAPTVHGKSYSDSGVKVVVLPAGVHAEQGLLVFRELVTDGQVRGYPRA